MELPLISIVLCTYNGENYIEAQLDSIFRQTYLKLEIIAVDDDSTDMTPDLLKNYVEKENRLKVYFNHSRLGYNANFEKASMLSHGSLIAFSDQDDIWHPEKIERLVNVWSPGISLVYCDSQQFEGSLPDRPLFPYDKYRRFEGKDPRKLSFFNTISGHSMIIERDLLSDIFPVGPATFYDWKSGIAAACKGGVKYLPDTLVYQRIHSNNVSVSDETSLRSKIGRRLHRELLSTQIPEMLTLTCLSKRDRLFFEKLHLLISTSFQIKFSFALFTFLMTNRKLIFWHKKREFPFFTYLKNSIRFAYS